MTKETDLTFLDDPDVKIDLHIHSTASDGTMTPSALVEKYSREGYSVIALTDHDGTDGVEEAQKRGRELGLRVLPGIEIGTVVRNRYELHILGYDIDIHSPRLTKELADMRRYRIERNKKLLAYFQSLGLDLTFEDLLQTPGQNYVGKPNFARALVAKGYAGSVSEVFRSPRFLASPEALTLKKKKVVTRDAISWIREAGGWAVLAHPMKIRGLGGHGSSEFFRGLDDILGELSSCGLAGLEICHPSASEADSVRLAGLADRHRLRKTRGSDFHGPGEHE